MASRLLARLDAAIAAERDPLEAELLWAERIGLVAREGHPVQARRELAALRTRQAGRLPHAALTAALALADALVDYFSDLSTEARLKLEQALSLSGSARRRPLQALAAAWLAHLDYVLNDMAAMARHAAQAFALAEPEHHGARSRASLVVAMAYHHAGRFALAQPWYERARRHANAEGDAATLSALMHNMAALRGSQARQAAVLQTGGDHHDEATYALAGGQSSNHYDQLMGGAVLEVLQPILRAQVLAVQGRYAHALAHYEGYLREAVRTGLGRMESSLRADMAWCRLRLRQPEMARQQAEAAVAALGPRCDEDDVAVTHGRLSQVYAELGEPTLASEHAALAQRHWQQHVQMQERIVALLDAALGPQPEGA